MKFKIGNVSFFPFEVIRRLSYLILFLFLVIFFSNVFTMWGEVFSGRSPYGSSEDFQTLNGEFKYTLKMSKFTTAEEELLELNNAFDKFKEENTLFQKAILYRTSEYYNINVWKLWKWYRYFETSHILSYPYLENKTNIK
ncbi:hypothetical protein [Pedobacter jejuensis]|nr:hypothetical protein [Pedobacter jejuensis]